MAIPIYIDVEWNTERLSTEKKPTYTNQPHTAVFYSKVITEASLLKGRGLCMKATSKGIFPYLKYFLTSKEKRLVYFKLMF